MNDQNAPAGLSQMPSGQISNVAPEYSKKDTVLPCSIPGIQTQIYSGNELKCHLIDLVGSASQLRDL